MNFEIIIWTRIGQNDRLKSQKIVYIYNRYFLIMLIGFAPLLLLIKNSELNQKIFKFKKLALIFVILNIFVPIHWLMFIDWGRAVNITYVSSILFFFYLFKNDFIKINLRLIEDKTFKIVNNLQKNLKIKSKSILIVFF